MKKLLVGLLLSLMFVSVASATTVNLNWVVDDEIYAQTTCETGNTLTFPSTTPTKRGYDFNGWVVAVYDFSILDCVIAGTDFTFDISTMTWAVTFPYGVVSGIALCSQTNGSSFADAGTPDESGTGELRICWCKTTGYTPTGSDIVNQPVSPMSWIQRNNFASTRNCTLGCARDCATDVESNYTFRYAAFNSVQQ